MRKTILLFTAVVTAFSCSQKWNDLVHEEVPAEITALELEGQSAVRISKATRVVTATFPKGTELNALTVNTLKVTEGASCSRVIKAGDVLDLTDTLKITLTTYDDYLWKIVAEEEKPVEPQPKDGPQLYNFTFDHWFQENENLKVYDPFDQDATEAEKAVWGNADKLIAALGFPTMSPEYEFVAVPGQGKAALRLVFTGTVFGDPRRLFKDDPALFGFGGDDVSDTPLPDDGVAAAPEPGIHKQILDVF